MPQKFDRTPDVVVVSGVLLSVLRTRLAFDAEGVFRYCWHAVKLMGVTGLALPTMSSSPSHEEPASPAFLSCPSFEEASTLVLCRAPTPSVSDRAYGQFARGR